MIVWIQGSKRDITTPCVYFAIRTMVLFKVLFESPIAKKSFFHKKGFLNQISQLVIYCICSCPSMSKKIIKSNFNKYEFLKMYKFYQILCFISKNDHNFKLYHNMLKFPSVISCIISYNFFLNNIYITSHLHVVKDSEL
jgi:hypothetical protein